MPYADAMLVPLGDTVDPVAIASLSDNIPDGWRAVAPTVRSWPRSTQRIAGFWWRAACSIGLYAAAFASAYGVHVDYVDTDPQRLAMAEKLGATVHDGQSPISPWTLSDHVHTTAEPAVLAATCVPHGRTGSAPTPASTRAVSRCRCWRCTPAVCGSSPLG